MSRRIHNFGVKVEIFDHKGNPIKAITIGHPNLAPAAALEEFERVARAINCVDFSCRCQDCRGSGRRGRLRCEKCKGSGLTQPDSGAI